MNQDDLEYLYNKLANLSEIRGQLSPTGNKITEEQIRTVKRLIIEAEADIALSGGIENE